MAWFNLKVLLQVIDNWAANEKGACLFVTFSFFLPYWVCNSAGGFIQNFT